MPHSHRPHHFGPSSCSAAEEGGGAAARPTFSNQSSAISHLLLKESHHLAIPRYRLRCRNLTARQDSINWILKVHEHYRFSPVTAMLSVNYLDRFLSSESLPEGSGWAFQLLSVACLSLAAKMEEPTVPLLLDLQIFEPRFVFEPKTVQRMELLVMANLDWRLRSVTPFDFLDFFISKLPSPPSPSSSSSISGDELLARLHSISSDLILSTIRVVDFLGFPPSAVAAAAVLTAAGGTAEFPANDHWLLESYCEPVNKETVRSCHQLMEEYLIDTCPEAPQREHRAEPAAPPSPVGVLDAAACGSCETRSENPTTSGSSRAEPPNKRLRYSAPDVQPQ